MNLQYNIVFLSTIIHLYPFSLGFSLNKWIIEINFIVIYMYLILKSTFLLWNIQMYNRGYIQFVQMSLVTTRFALQVLWTVRVLIEHFWVLPDLRFKTKWLFLRTRPNCFILREWLKLWLIERNTISVTIVLEIIYFKILSNRM